MHVKFVDVSKRRKMEREREIESENEWEKTGSSFIKTIFIHLE